MNKLFLSLIFLPLSTFTLFSPRELDDKLLEATKAGDARRVTQLLNQGATKLDDQLLAAARIGDAHRVDELLKQGASKETVDSQGHAPLHYTAERDHTNVAKLLLDKGADANAANVVGTTPLHRSAEKGHTNVAQLLLDKGANPNATDTLGKTPLHYAIMGQNKAIVQLLLKGGNPNMPNKNGWTPLHYAAIHGNTDIVQLLLQAGADPSIKNQQGETALDMVQPDKSDIPEKIENKKVIAQMLQEHQQPVQHAMQSKSITPVSPIAPVQSCNVNPPAAKIDSLQPQVFMDKLKEMASEASKLHIDGLGNTQLHYAVTLPNVHPAIVAFIISLNKELLSMRNKSGRLPIELIPGDRDDLIELFLPFLV
ncbi:ankyrin repeat domain-containing protein [Candidatus Dependentiae bacterium]|nr:ankyrin repeat domain-containing protein [Candidatus Dependentiae bacterium]